jgi:hypothetical protein
MLNPAPLSTIEFRNVSFQYGDAGSGDRVADAYVAVKLNGEEEEDELLEVVLRPAP